MPDLLVRRLVAPLVPLLLLAGCSSKDGSATKPGATPSASTTVESPSPEEIVDDPESRLLDMAVLPGAPDARASVWKLCPDDQCAARSSAVALTGDGFSTRVVADHIWHSTPDVVMSASGDALVVAQDDDAQLTVVRPDGSLVEVERTRSTKPVREGEVVVTLSSRRTGSGFWAVDTTSARAHRVPVKVFGSAYLFRQTDGGQLRALTVEQTHAWSDDGGATWQEQPGAGVMHGPMYADFAESVDDTHVVVRGSDGATLFPFEQIRRLDPSGSWSVTELPRDPLAYVGPTAVLTDGRFLASVVGWSDDGRLDRPLKGTPPGIYVSDGEDWSTYERIESGAPFATPARGEPVVTDIDVTADGALITALGPDGASVWTSKDLGATWLEMRAR